jgi:hypothetical protein
MTLVLNAQNCTNFFILFCVFWVGVTEALIPVAQGLACPKTVRHSSALLGQWDGKVKFYLNRGVDAGWRDRFA